MQLEVITEHNGGICSRDFVETCTTGRSELVRFHSDFFTLNPGDLISTGCPKGARITPEGTGCAQRIEGSSRQLEDRPWRNGGSPADAEDEGLRPNRPPVHQRSIFSDS